MTMRNPCELYLSLAHYGGAPGHVARPYHPAVSLFPGAAPPAVASIRSTYCCLATCCLHALHLPPMILVMLLLSFVQPSAYFSLAHLESFGILCSGTVSTRPCHQTRCLSTKATIRPSTSRTRSRPSGTTSRSR